MRLKTHTAANATRGMYVSFVGGGGGAYFTGRIFAIFNQFKPNGIYQYYQLYQSISVLRVAGCIVHFYSNFNRTFCKQTVETLIRRRLIWASLFAYIPQKDVRLIWVKHDDDFNSLNTFGKLWKLQIFAFATRLHQRQLN